MLSVIRKIPSYVQVVCYCDSAIECLFNLTPSIENALQFMREYPDVCLIEAMKDEVFSDIREMVVAKNPQYADRLHFTFDVLDEVTVEDSINVI